MTSDQTQTEIDRLRAEVAPALARIADLERSHRLALSREWIAATGVRQTDVQPSSGDEMPYFNHVSSFADWMRQQSPPKPWAEWNGRIYSTAALMEGRMGDGIGLYEHAHE